MNSTSRHASLIGRYVFSKVAHKFSDVVMASEFGYFAPSLGTETVVIAVSQSGETADVLDGVRLAKQAGAEVVAVVNEISTGMGLAIIGAGIPTALSTIGAGIAVGPIGAASLAAITEKPENLGRTLIYLGLAEGIAIYGLVVSILLLNKIP
mgnify:FL=1